MEIVTKKRTQKYIFDGYLYMRISFVIICFLCFISAHSLEQMVKPFLEPKTYNKVTFVYPGDPKSRLMMEELFDMDKLESCYGGNNTVESNFEAYAQKMKEDDRRMSDVIDSGCSTPSILSSEVCCESLYSRDNDSMDGTSGDETVYSNLEEDDEARQVEIPCSQDEPKNEVHEKKNE